jgi:hypothetical protein
VVQPASPSCARTTLCELSTTQLTRPKPYTCGGRSGRTESASVGGGLGSGVDAEACRGARMGRWVGNDERLCGSGGAPCRPGPCDAAVHATPAAAEMTCAATAAGERPEQRRRSGGAAPAAPRASGPAWAGR